MSVCGVVPVVAIYSAGSVVWGICAGTIGTIEGPLYSAVSKILEARVLLVQTSKERRVAIVEAGNLSSFFFRVEGRVNIWYCRLALYVSPKS